MSSSRALGAVWMIIFLIWLPFEDTSLWMSLLLASGLTAWMGLRFAAVLRNNLRAASGLGALLPLFTISLMAFKSGLHAHGFADFTGRQILQVLYLIPITALAGLLVAVLQQRFHLFNRGTAK